MSPLHAFEVFFLLAQIMRHSTEAYYFLKHKTEDTEFRYVVGFGCLISAAWFIVAVLRYSSNHALSKNHPITQS